jgi:predicted RNA-binding protein YlxR (DUF448 family)
MVGRENGARAIRRVRPRTCIGCGTESPKRGLIRVVRKPDGGFAIDPTGRAPGRGAYLCVNIECVKEARRRKALSRCLKVEVPPSFYDEIEAFIETMSERKA